MLQDSHLIYSEAVIHLSCLLDFLKRYCKQIKGYEFTGLIAAVLRPSKQAYRWLIVRY